MTEEQMQYLISVTVQELDRVKRIPFRLLADREALMYDFARSIADQIRHRNVEGLKTRFILPVGPVAQYPILVDICNRERISWKNVYTFNMDEFLDWQARPIPVSHPMSFEGYIRREIFGRLDPDLRPAEDHMFFPNALHIDEISRIIERVGGIDCCYGGIGYHGHVAFNEPPLSRWRRISVEQLRGSLTRILELGDDSIVVQSIHCSGGGAALIPPMAVTLGMRDILASRKIRLYCAAGERHRAVFRITVAGEVAVDYPSTLVQGHPDAEIITDTATAQPVNVSLG